MINGWESVRGWVTGNPRQAVIAAAAVLTLIAVSWLAVRAAAAVRDRDLNAKASIGFGVVQVGVAFITITGVYEFFAHRLHMPGPEAWTLAGFIEACTWAAVGMIYAHGRTPGTVGFGDAGGFFWMTLFGGGGLAILGSASLPVAVGRSLVVALGGYMWWLRLRAATRPSSTPTRLRITPKRVLVALGVLGADEGDVVHDDREWTVRRLARAMRWMEGTQPWAWLGARLVDRNADRVSADVLAEARMRRATARVLRDDLRPGSAAMVAAEAAARAALAPPAAATFKPDPAPVPEPEPQPEQPTPAPPPAPPSPPSRGGGERNASLSPTVVRARAELWAYDQLRGGRPVTARLVGERFGLKEEWGRQRLNAARERLARESASPVAETDAAETADPEPVAV